MNSSWIVILALAVIGSASSAYAAKSHEEALAELPRQAASAAGFVPKGWVLVDQAVGDINGDGAPDIVFVVQQNDASNILNRGGAPTVVDTNPRILGVAFGQRRGPAYRLAVENHVLVPQLKDYDFESFEPGYIKVQPGGFSLSLDNDWNYHATYKIRWLNGRFKLIGFEALYYWHNEDMRGVSINYLTRKLKKTRMEIGSDKESVGWRKLGAGPMPDIAQIGSDFLLDPLHESRARRSN